MAVGFGEFLEMSNQGKSLILCRSSIRRCGLANLQESIDGNLAESEDHPVVVQLVRVDMASNRITQASKLMSDP